MSSQKDDFQARRPDQVRDSEVISGFLLLLGISVCAGLVVYKFVAYTIYLYFH